MALPEYIDGEDDGLNSKRNARRPNPIDTHVGGRVRVRRMLLGMSQEKLGELLGLTFQQVQKYEKGANRIGASRLYDLSRILKVPVSYFFVQVYSGKPGTAEAPGFAENGNGEGFDLDVFGSRDGIDLNRAFAKIQDPRTRRAVIELVRSIAEGTGPGFGPRSDPPNHR